MSVLHSLTMNKAKAKRIGSILLAILLVYLVVVTLIAFIRPLFGL